MDSGEQAHHGNKANFSLELYWLRKECFFEMVANEWAAVSHGHNPTEVW
jgi:hypothetical protein